MDFAHFVVQNAPVDESILDELSDSNEKVGDILIQKKIMSRRELMKLLTAYAKQESANNGSKE